jgi:hypothetical protein
MFHTFNMGSLPPLTKVGTLSLLELLMPIGRNLIELTLSVEIRLRVRVRVRIRVRD